MKPMRADASGASSNARQENFVSSFVRWVPLTVNPIHGAAMSLALRADEIIGLSSRLSITEA